MTNENGTAVKLWASFITQCLFCTDHVDLAIQILMMICRESDLVSGGRGRVNNGWRHFGQDQTVKRRSRKQGCHTDIWNWKQ